MTDQLINFWSCPHNRLSQPRARKITGGVQYRYQCLDCGAAVGTVIAKAVALQETGERPDPFDEELFLERKGAARTEYQLAKEAERARWWDWYNSYLKSPEWRERREKVLRRAKGICEGCLSRRAVQVHHRTYEHVGHELLFELVALCEDCHDLAHGDNPNAQPMSVRFPFLEGTES